MEGALQDGAAHGDPAAAGAVLGLLKSIGLVGPRLAFQVGEEESLAAQVAERLGLQPDQWLLDLLKVQVETAIRELEMTVRLSGGSKPPGEQAIDDAVSSVLKAREEPASSWEGPRPVKSVQVPRRGKLKKLPVMVAQEGAAEELEEGKIIALLYEELVMMDAPIVHDTPLPRTLREQRDPCWESSVSPL